MSSERTEPATPRKLRKARERGQVWRSRDLTSSLILVTAAGVLALQGPALLERLRVFMATIFREACSPEPPEPELVLHAALSTTIACLAPLLGSVVLVAAAVNLLQVRPLFTVDPLKLRLERLNPVTGLRQIFSTRGLFIAAISLAKVLVVAAVLVWTVLSDLRHLVVLVHAGPSAGVAAAGEVIGSLLWRGALVLLLLSVLDVVYQRHRYLKDQRMTKGEVKQERRETEGDQSQKGERKRLHQEILEHAMLEQVRKADVVIVNPTHLAVALGYRPDEDDAPAVLATGQNVLARKIVEEARRQGIPILRDVQLARSLSKIEVGEHIPEELYEAVAEILRFVMSDAHE